MSLTDHSPSGWTNLETWLNYIFTIRYEWFPPESIDILYSEKSSVVVFCDAYPVHHAQAAIRFGILLNVFLVQIPKGMTDYYQPLDNMIFGRMKSEARAFINTRNAKRILDIFDPETGTLKELIKPQEPLNKKEALIIMEQIWNRIDETSILQAWENSILTHTSQLQINEDEIAKVKASCKTTLQRVEKEVRENVPVFNLSQLKNIISIREICF